MEMFNTNLLKAIFLTILMKIIKINCSTSSSTSLSLAFSSRIQIDLDSNKAREIVINECKEEKTKSERIFCQIKAFRKLEIRNNILNAIADSDKNSRSFDDHLDIDKAVETFLQKRKRKRRSSSEEELKNCKNFEECLNTNNAGDTDILILKANHDNSSLKSALEGRIRFNIAEISQYKFRSALILFSIKEFRLKYENALLKIHFHKFISEDEFLIDNISRIIIDYSNKNVNNDTEEDLDWFFFPASDIIKFWQKNLQKNFGFSIKVVVYDGNDNEIHIENIKPKFISDFQVFLEIEKPRVRRQRRTLSHPIQQISKKCCIRTVKVRFEEFGWDWVVSPSNIVVSYCTTFCDDRLGSEFQNLKLNSELSRRRTPLTNIEQNQRFSSILYRNGQGFLQSKRLTNLSSDQCLCHK